MGAKSGLKQDAAYPNLLTQNIYSPCYREAFLVIGTCIPVLYPDIMKRYAKQWKNVVSFCLEQAHYNQLMSKLFNILQLGKTQNVGFLTVDGSPHCIQMHFVSKYLARGMKNEVEYCHYVIAKNTVYQIPTSEIDAAKDFCTRGIKII